MCSNTVCRVRYLTITSNSLQIDDTFSCVSPVFDHEFCHGTVKLAEDPRGDSRVNTFQTTFLQVMQKFIVNKRRDA